MNNIHQGYAKAETSTGGTGVSIDPVCGMTVNPDVAVGSYEYHGQTYYFCSTHCLNKFREAPERFLNKSPEAMPSQPVEIQRDTKPTGAAVAQTYTCPMHPEVKRDKPGSCPKCGMALEPVTTLRLQFPSRTFPRRFKLTLDRQRLHA